MKKTVKLLISIFLILTMLMGTVPVSASNAGDKPEEWQLIYSYEYNYGKDNYSVKIYRNETVFDCGIKYISTKYKFVAYNNDDLVNGVEYITPKPHNWSLDYIEYAQYKKDAKIHKEKTFSTLQKAIKKDEYLTINLFYKPQIINKLKTNSFSYLCINCVDACRDIKVCRYCKGDLENTIVRKTYCKDCKKSNYLSLAKTVCSTCRGENLISRKSLWQNNTVSSLCDANKYLPNLVHNCQEEDELSAKDPFYMLKYNWEHAADDTIVGDARKIQPDWEKAEESYYNQEMSNESFEEQSLINAAVYENRRKTFKEFSETTTTELIEKYIEMAKEYYANAFQSGINNIQGEAIGLFAELVPDAEILKKLVEVVVTLVNTDSDDTDKIKVDDIIKLFSEKFGSENLSELMGCISEGQETAKEVGQLCLTVADDLSNYYESTNIILNGSKFYKERSICNLCDDIALAAILKRVDETLKIKK